MDIIPFVRVVIIIAEIAEVFVSFILILCDSVGAGATKKKVLTG